MFSNIFYEVYKYADIETPPSTSSKKFEITVQASNIIIEYNNKQYNGYLDEYKKIIKEIFKNEFIRRIYLIANDCQIFDETGNIVSSAFFNWSEQFKVKILKDNFEIEVPIRLSIGNTFQKVPERWIKVNFIGYTGDATLNGKHIEINNRISLPPNIYTLETPYETLKFNLENIYNEYTVYLTSETITKKIEFEKIVGIFDLKSGVEITGKNKSVWISKSDDNIIVKENSLFVSPYGILEKNKGIQFHGMPIYAYEDNYTIYIITSYGEILTMGLRNIIKDMGRSPASITNENNKLFVSTFGGKRYIIDLKTGGLYNDNQNLEIKNTIKIYTEKTIYLKNKSIIIQNNKIKVVKKVSEE
ncbi:hypothetical protein X274_00710 [Marinitoga sp. 1155]|nr:hypothetical protein X274_00710 [Marinitoga sp. 1155]NUU98659.1 hypothetical protein [Marinitoga sp. 1154]